jgi:hypothetical protein
MAIEYTVYFNGEINDLKEKIHLFFSQVGAQAVFRMYGVEEVNQLQRDILNEEGFRCDFRSQAWFRADKDQISEAADTIRHLRNEVLRPNNSLALVNGEAELPDT